MVRKRESKLTEGKLIDFIRQEKRTTLPPWGGWVTIIGNPKAPRGLRIPESIHELGVHHLDIYYAYDESTPWTMYGDTVLSLSRNQYEDITDLMLSMNSVTELQTTWMTLHTPVSQLIRMWNGEVRPFSEELIKDMLKENYLKTVPMGYTRESPIWDELTRDLIGSLQLDGLSFQEAQFELISSGEVEFERDPHLPPYFYRAIGDYYDQFSEEPEHDAWLKEVQHAKVQAESTA